mgnify:CR=1 FL=1
MLSILSSILGFATAGLPNILSFFQQRGDQSHERQMAKLQTERELALAEKGFLAQQKIEEIKLEEDEIENIKNMICKEYEKYIDINKEYNEIINKINEFKIDIYKNDKEIDEIVIILEKYNKYKNEFNRSNIINKKIIKKILLSSASVASVILLTLGV